MNDEGNALTSDAIDGSLRMVRGERRHLDGICALYHLSQSYHHTLNPTIAPAVPDAEVRRFVGRYLRRLDISLRGHRRRALIAEADGKVLGYVLYALYRNRDVTLSHKGTVCFLEDIAVAPDERNSLVATQLCNTLEVLVQSMKPVLAKATVWNGNDACLRLLERFGMKEVSRNYFLHID